MWDPPGKFNNEIKRIQKRMPPKLNREILGQEEGKSRALFLSKCFSLGGKE